ncbi:hypothetical protein MYXO_03160 [Myxococcaceae bacterium]|jgi:hypothetical protein|nr:hypothetical protein MYXO_03160 [Myxococcaceae bacterium]
MNTTMIAPALALVCWTLVMWCWMYATRIPAMRAAGLDPGALKQKADLDVLPIAVRQVADNYNHLHEQPVIFYALVFYSQLAGNGDSTNVALAWAYVGIRVLHSVYQSLVNHVPVRFAIFTAGSVVLMVLTVRNVLAAF